MPPVIHRDILPKDLQDPTLAELNSRLKEIYSTLNLLQGYRGPIPLNADLNLNSNRITNLGSAKAATDALNQTAADPMYSTATQQAQMQALGKAILQTTRQLNNPVQQHTISSDLNSQGSIPPSNVTGTLAWTTSGTQITWTWTSVVVQLADLSYRAIQDGTLAVTGLTNGAQYDFFPYYDAILGILAFVADSVNGAGSPEIAIPSGVSMAITSLELQQQNADTRIALTEFATDAQVTCGGSPGTATLRTRT